MNRLKSFLHHLTFLIIKLVLTTRLLYSLPLLALNQIIARSNLPLLALYMRMYSANMHKFMAISVHWVFGDFLIDSYFALPGDGFIEDR
uniref:Uncharacterized protein n=1 Tax=mine drainage metagenome TaxID=410659 RepID=E6QIV3_9ZZZZ